jgi:hypothetical protein
MSDAPKNFIELIYRRPIFFFVIVGTFLIIAILKGITIETTPITVRIPSSDTARVEKKSENETNEQPNLEFLINEVINNQHDKNKIRNVLNVLPYDLQVHHIVNGTTFSEGSLETFLEMLNTSAPNYQIRVLNADAVLKTPNVPLMIKH